MELEGETESCQLVHYRDGRYGIGPHCPQHFRGETYEGVDVDDPAWKEIAAVIDVVDGSGARLTLVQATYGSDKSVRQGRFELDDCPAFVHEPGHRALPGADSVLRFDVVNQDWYVITHKWSLFGC